MPNDDISERVESDRDQSGQAKQNGHDDDESVGEIPFLSANVAGNSRLRSEFEVLQFLGKGGFGSVIKVFVIDDAREFSANVAVKNVWR